MRIAIAGMLIGAVLCARGEAAAQSPWGLVVSVSPTTFTGGSRSTTGEGEAVHPTRGNAVGIGLTRTLGAWRGEIVADYLGSNLQLVSPDLAVTVRTFEFSRGRVGARLSRPMMRRGAAELRAGGGIFLETWITADEARPVASAEGSLSVRFAAGRMALENGLAITYSRSPIEAADVPDGYDQRALSSVALVARLTFGL